MHVTKSTKMTSLSMIVEAIGIGYFESNEINNTSTYPLMCANIYPSGLNKIVKKKFFRSELISDGLP